MLNWIRAFFIMLNAHKGQKDKAGKPYFLHPLRVQRKHKYGIIPCHDGTIWKYETSDNISLIKYNVEYDKFRKSNYTRLKKFI